MINCFPSRFNFAFNFHLRRYSLGGGFGGKETRAAFLNVCAAVPSFHLRRPVSLVLDRHVDMAVTAGAHTRPRFSSS
jgi:xanthine dehydrogenase molybdopterin-binding subunit B